MPRNMSFALTTPQFQNRTKTVTRRLGWWNLKPGDIVCGVKKAMGLKKGEKIQKLGLIRILASESEPLYMMPEDDTAKEGFPHYTAAEFVEMFCEHNKCTPKHFVNRIEFEYLEEA